jgi:hypothetical protein
LLIMFSRVALSSGSKCSSPIRSRSRRNDQIAALRQA